MVQLVRMSPFVFSLCCCGLLLFCTSVECFITIAKSSKLVSVVFCVFPPAFIHRRCWQYQVEISFSFIFLTLPCSVPLSSYLSACMLPCAVCLCLSSLFTYAKPLVCRQCILIATAELYLKIDSIYNMHSLVMGLPHSTFITLLSIVCCVPVYSCAIHTLIWSPMSH